MLSPYKLYKLDKPLAREAVTLGPKGRPAIGSSGTACYNHYNIDWTIHRLTPAIAARGKPGGMRRKAIGQLAALYNGKALSYELKRRPATTLKATSPRWGEGDAPGLKKRPIVPLPKKGTAEVSKSTKIGAGTAGAAVGSYKLSDHFHNGINFSHPKYKSKINKGSYTEYKY